MVLLKYLPVDLVDVILIELTKREFGNLSKYGIVSPKEGPLAVKLATGRTPVIDVGTVEKIKSGDIQVVKGLSNIEGNEVTFSDGRSFEFDAIIFATGYKTTTNAWLKDQSYSGNWKGKNGLYFAGFSQNGLAGVSKDAQNIANDIKLVYGSHQST